MKILYYKWPDLSGIKRRWNYLKICFLTLTYNTYSSASDMIFEPIITLVDFMARWFGFAFVTLVTILVPYVVVAYYLMAVPYITETYSFPYAAVTIFYGHYLLIMISFHYFKAVRTDPGRPPKDASDRAVTSVCKKCILPKPPRTHHCSVCKNCVLKMDHHCPWINNCVGHFNHRYFISFCIFMLLGTVFVITTTWPLFYDCFHVPHKAKFTRDWITSIFVSLPEENEVGKRGPKSEDGHNIFKHDIGDASKLENSIFSKFGDSIKFPEAEQIPLQPPQDLCYDASSTYRTNVIFLWLLCFGVTGALGTLTAVQFRLISHGETSIEKLINEKEEKKARKLGLKYQNPYHLGFVGNWKMLLEFHDLKSFFWNVILPRVSLPLGDGLIWDKYVNVNYSDEMYSNGH